MKKLAKGSLIADLLHKGFVLSCVGITAYGVGHLGMRWYRYFTVLRPESKLRELTDKQELLAEGSSDMLKDNAATIST